MTSATDRGAAVLEGRYAHVAMHRSTNGVLELRLHTEGGPLIWGETPHTELGRCFAEVGSDPANRVVLITGTGDRFCNRIDDSLVGPMTPATWETIYRNGRRLLRSLLEIEVPVVVAVNGPATVHAELAVLADIVIASDTAYFQDAPHFRFHTVPGDGVHTVWPLLLGPNRGRYFLLTGQKIAADEALRLGVVSEVLPPDELLSRARELADDLARFPDVTLRYTRVALNHQLRRMLHDQTTYGLALEGLAAHETWPTGQS